MKMKKFINCFYLILILSSFSFAQKPENEKNQPQTDSKPKIYRNYLYKFSFELPQGWTEISSEDSKIYAEVGTTMLKPNEKGKKQAEESSKNTQILLNTSKNAPGMLENVSLICAVETGTSPDVTIEETALATQLAFQNNFGYTIASSAKKTKLGNGEFYAIKLSRAIAPNLKLFQTLYLRKIGDVVLQFVVTHTNEADTEIVEKSLQTLKFTN